jgi:Ca2+-transporting ATPase
MRVIGLAHKPVPTATHSIDDKSFTNLVWTGAIGLIDPPRPEAVESVKRVIASGVRVIMATGDHPETALSIADAVGIRPASYSVTASEMDAMTDQEINDAIQTTSVFARMTPQSKLRLARILQKQGMILAMTGDGVNDAPALKGADVGVSMGMAGTDVAREASDIILADDNFATIVAAIEEGRTQFRNMRRTSFFLITTNVAESVSLLTFLFLGLPIPLLPKQVLWLNLIGGGLTDLALATEPIHEDVLKTPPHRAGERILNKQVLPLLVLFTLLMTAAALGVHQLYFSESEMKARTAVFVTLSLMQLLNLFNMRSLKKSIFEIGIFTNKQVNYAFLISLVFLLGVVYIPFVAKLFEFQALAVDELFLLDLISFSILAVGEGVKLVQRFRFQD